VPRTKIQAIAVLATVLGIAAPAAENRKGEPMSTEDAKFVALRQKAARRKRRIILNNDGGDGLAKKAAGDTSALDVFLKQRTAALVGSQVDTIFYCTGWAFGTMLHRTKVAENMLLREGAGYQDGVLKDLLDQGTDSLQVMVEFCRKNKIEVFWSMRMNDTHDAKNPLLRAKMKADHPEYLIGGGKKPKYGQWTAVNFGNADVRELVYRYIEEVCTNYDVDGVEMDFFRHPVLFKSHAFGGVASDEERALLTALIGRIREMTDAIGKKRGKPILLATRVPDSVEFCRNIGIDLEGWLRDGLVDMLITGAYFRLNPWEYSVELGHRYGVPVYPSLDNPVGVVDPNMPKREFTLNERWPWVSATKQCPVDARRRSIGSWRGRAARAFDAGADGVYLFNMFKPANHILWQIGDREYLKTASKLYFLHWRGTRQPPANYMTNGNTFYHELPLNPMFPLEIKEQPLTVNFPIGDDLRGGTPTATAELWIQPAACHESVSVTCNGHPLTGGTSTGERLKFSLPPAAAKQGKNVFALSRTPVPEAGKAFLRDIALDITYPAAKK
jgi:hypothetical protein